MYLSFHFLYHFRTSTCMWCRKAEGREDVSLPCTLLKWRRLRGVLQRKVCMGTVDTLCKVSLSNLFLVSRVFYYEWILEDFMFLSPLVWLQHYFFFLLLLSVNVQSICSDIALTSDISNLCPFSVFLTLVSNYFVLFTDFYIQFYYYLF